jgi:rRNA-processing protein FCF1
MPKYVIDTSFLLRLAEPGGLRGGRSIELTRGEFVLTRPVQSELTSLARRPPRARAKAAQLALEAAAHLVVVDTPEGVDTDEALVEIARKHGYGVATLDQRLRRRLRTLGVPVLTLRAGHPTRESER